MTIKVSTIKDKFVTDIYCAEDVTIDVSLSPLFRGGDIPMPIEYKGNYFLMDMNTFLFFHTLNEGIAQYVMLKEIIKDLQLVPMIVENSDFSYDSTIDFYLEILKPFNITKNDIVKLNDFKPTFEKVYYYVVRVNSFLEQLDIPQGRELYGETPFFLDGYYALRKTYDPYLVKDESLPKKIFFTRLDKDDDTRKLHDLAFAQDIYDAPEHPEVSLSIRNFGSRDYFNQMLRERHIVREEQERLENYFIQNGYTVVDPEKLSFFEQIQYYYNATHVASMRGSALLNTLFCDEGTKIFILDTNVSYTFPYKEICSIYNHEVYEIPFELKLKKYMPSELFCVKNILGILKTHYSDKV